MQISTETIPTVSVIMPIHNGARFLVAALDSVLTQTGVDFELICIDDGSTDESWPTLRKFADRYGIMRVCRSEGRGISDALNQGLRLSRGRYIARMDADDICRPGRLAMQARWLDSHPTVGVLGAQALSIDVSGVVCGRIRVPVGTKRVHAALWKSSPFIHSTVMMRRRLVLAVGGYRRLFDGAEDYDLWLRLGLTVAMDNLAQPVLLYRRHCEQTTARHPFRQARLAAIAVVAYQLRRECRRDPTENLAEIAHWRAAFGAIDRACIDEIRLLTASRLGDNGGTLRDSGVAYLRLSCGLSAGRGSIEVRRRLALACVRHQVQTLRSKGWRKASEAFAHDILYWRGRLLHAYIDHASVLWRSQTLLPAWVAEGRFRSKI